MIAVAALGLSAAILVAPSSPGRRLAATSGHRGIPWVVVTAALSAVGLVMLSVTTIVACAVLASSLFLRHRRGRRKREACSESRQLETAVDILVGELRVGAHPATAFAVAAEETAGSVAAACRAVAARARLSADVAAGLRGVAESSALPSQWERLAVCWQLAAEHGLAMSDLMRAAQRDIAERQRFSDQVRSAMAGARATAVILAALPVLSVMMGQLIGARTLQFLLGGGLGGTLLIVGLTLVCAGLMWADRITDRATA